MTWLVRRPTAIATVAMALLVVATPCAADLRIVEATGPDHPLDSSRDQGQVVLAMEVDCASAALRLEPGASGIPLRLNVTAPEGVLVAGVTTLSVPVPSGECPADPIPVTTTFSVALLDWVPALQPQTITFQATLDPAAGGVDHSSDEAQVQVQSAPSLLLDASTSNLGVVAGTATDLPFVISNLGNAPVLVVAVIEASSGAVDYPAESGPVAPGGQATVTATYLPPSGSWLEAVVTATFVAREPASGHESQPAQVRVVVRNPEAGEGSVDVPGLPAVALVGSLALLARMRRT